MCEIQQILYVEVLFFFFFIEVQYIVMCGLSV